MKEPGYPSVSSEEFLNILTTSSGFEHFLFDNRVARIATHTMEYPVVITQGFIPSALKGLLYDEDGYVVSDLSATQNELIDKTEIEIRFKANEETHVITQRIETNNTSVTRYSRPNSYGDLVQYDVPDAIPVSFLSLLVYVRQYDPELAKTLRDQNDIRRYMGDQEINTDIMLEESVIDRERLGDTDMNERLLMTLGNFDGESEITTSAILYPEDEVVLATLSRSESPRTACESTNLDMSVLNEDSLTHVFNVINLSQNIGKIRPMNDIGDLRGEIAEATQQGSTRMFTPEKTPAMWKKIAEQIYESLENSVTPYLEKDSSMY